MNQKFFFISRYSGTWVHFVVATIMQQKATQEWKISTQIELMLKKAVKEKGRTPAWGLEFRLAPQSLKT